MYSYIKYGNDILIEGTLDYTTYFNPEGGKTLKLFMSYIPTALTEDTSEASIPSMYHSALADYALFLLTDNPVYLQKYNASVKDAIKNKSTGAKRIKQTFF